MLETEAADEITEEDSCETVTTVVFPLTEENVIKDEDSWEDKAVSDGILISVDCS